MLSRRALLAGGVATFAAPAILARAQNSEARGATILRLERRNIEVNGRMASVYGIRQPNGTFGVTTEVGKPFRVRVENGIDEPSLIHWHGLTPPWRQDGVPGISGPSDSCGRQRGLRLPLALRRHVLDALASGAPGTAADERAAHHPRSARPAGRAGSRDDAGRFQLHAVRTDLRKSEELRVDGRHGETGRRHGFDVEHDNGGADIGGQTRARSQRRQV